MRGPVSVYIERCGSDHTRARKLLEQRTAEISPDCERVIGLNQPNPKFRSDIAGAIQLACGIERLRLAGDPEGDSPEGDTREIYPTIAPKTGQEHKDLTKLISRRERRYKAFDLLVKCLASAYTEATGETPSIPTYNDDYERGYGSFGRLMEIVLPVASEIAEADGIRFPQPNSPSARTKQIARVLTKRKGRASRANSQL